MTKDYQLLLQQYEKANDNRKLWESLWEDCYTYTFPNRQAFGVRDSTKSASSQIFDATAADAVDQLAAGILAELTPPFGHWIDLSPSPDYAAMAGPSLSKQLNEATTIFHEHLQKSNFLLEIHQAFMDSVIVGTSVLSFSEASENSDSVFQFAAVPLQQIAVLEGSCGKLNHSFRKSEYSLNELQAKFPQLADLHPPLSKKYSPQARANPDNEFAVIECVVPSPNGGYDYTAILRHAMDNSGALLLRQGHYSHSPFIAFRWMKVPGENYGRSPVMKLLPDIKTANRVVELILKNAAIAVSGIWQADDDGVLNPATIKLKPGTIIPKAVGSKGLTPLQPASDFNLSQLILEELRAQIRRGLLYDHLSPNFSPISTATEILEKSSRTARLLGATYGRLQSELLLPLAYRGFHILKRRGLIDTLPIDGVNINIRIQSPLARQQHLSQVQNIMQFIDYATRLGPHAAANIDHKALLSWLAQQMDIPDNIVPTISHQSEALDSSPDITTLLENEYAG